ncbi:MAG: nitrile hydratase subunit beta, partial [Betaproteobacteria bacterium]|nr:nitrile hydratase subunit beta [Betaproteobacteria bacterium]
GAHDGPHHQEPVRPGPVPNRRVPRRPQVDDRPLPRGPPLAAPAGRQGEVRRVHVLPDRHTAHPPTPEAEQGEWLYTVVFDARDLWGAQADPTVRVSVDAWESYLEPVVTA